MLFRNSSHPLSRRASADDNQAEPRQQDNDSRDRWNRNIVFLLRTDMYRTGVQYRFGVRVAEMSKQQAGGAQNHKDNPKNGKISHLIRPR
jgi:hypothetical protein